MNNLSLLEKKYLLLRIRWVVEQLITEGILTLAQAQRVHQLTAQQMAGK